MRQLKFVHLEFQDENEDSTYIEIPFNQNKIYLEVNE